MQEYSEGCLYYVEDFPFKNGHAPKNKFFLVLKNIGDELIIASLPTSKDHIPSCFDIHTGAYNIPSMMVSAFVFKSGDVIAQKEDGSDFSFPKNTFVYGEEIDSYPTDFLSGNKVTYIGKILTETFEDLLSGFRKSNVVKRKYKSLL